MARARSRNPVDGWVVLDKPEGMTSTAAVGAVKHLFNARKAGHAGTLDPLASGMLPIALGEATKTVAHVMDGDKRYRFMVRWGIETASDDREGEAVATSESRPEAGDIEAILADFTGAIMQTPPRYSAIKVAGERAYDMARDGREPELAARRADVHELRLVDCPDRDHAVFEAVTGKGAYVRALARDMGRALGCYGHVAALRRLAVGPFDADHMIGLEKLRELGHKDADPTGLQACLRPLATALDDIPALAVDSVQAARLRNGQSVILRGHDTPARLDRAVAMWRSTPVALCEVRGGEIRPRRVFNLARTRRPAQGGQN